MSVFYTIPPDQQRAKFAQKLQHDSVTKEKSKVDQLNSSITVESSTEEWLRKFKAMKKELFKSEKNIEQHLTNVGLQLKEERRQLESEKKTLDDYSVRIKQLKERLEKRTVDMELFEEMLYKCSENATKDKDKSVGLDEQLVLQVDAIKINQQDTEESGREDEWIPFETYLLTKAPNDPAKASTFGLIQKKMELLSRKRKTWFVKTKQLDVVTVGLKFDETPSTDSPTTFIKLVGNSGQDEFKFLKTMVDEIVKKALETTK